MTQRRLAERLNLDETPDQQVPVSAIAFDDAQPRQSGREDIGDLVESIRENGLQNAVLLRPPLPGEDLPEGKDRVVLTGERRVRSHIHLGRTHIRAKVVSADPPLTPDEILILQIDENDKRKDLSLFDDLNARVRAYNCSSYGTARDFCRARKLHPTWLSRAATALKLIHPVSGDERLAIELKEAARDAATDGTLRDAQALISLLKAPDSRIALRLLKSAGPDAPLSRRTVRALTPPEAPEGAQAGTTTFRLSADELRQIFALLALAAPASDRELLPSLRTHLATTADLSAAAEERLAVAS